MTGAQYMAAGSPLAISPGIPKDPLPGLTRWHMGCAGDRTWDLALAEVELCPGASIEPLICALTHSQVVITKRCDFLQNPLLGPHRRDVSGSCSQACPQMERGIHTVPPHLLWHTAVDMVVPEL